MRSLTSALVAAAFFLIPAESFAAGKPNTNIRVLLPAVNIAAKPKPRKVRVSNIVFTHKLDAASPNLN